jgi:HEAT repeat protein
VSDQGIPSPAQRRRAAALAGHNADVAEALRLSGDSDASVRATALAALARADALDADALLRGLRDPDPAVRRRAAALAANVGDRAAIADELLGRLGDDDHFVAETAAWAFGEWSDDNPRRGDAGAALTEMTTSHDEPLCREAAVAALGAIGDERGLVAILSACTDKPAIRRRAVLALAPFDGPDVEAAIDRALQDRDWQVRQAAEDLRR